MPRYDASSADCFVFVYKDGLFQAVGHDLKIRVADFTIDSDEATERISARFNPRSLRAECAVQRGIDRNDLLSGKDKEEINDHIVRDVLEAHKYDEIAFTSRFVTREEDRVLITGELFLHGMKKEITVLSHRKDGKPIAETTVSQPDFGIRPFSAFFGMLKIAPSVRIRVILGPSILPHARERI